MAAIIAPRASERMPRAPGGAGPSRHLQRTPIDPGWRHAEGRRKLVGELLGAEARGVGGQQHEPLGGDQLGNLAEQGSEVVLEPPPTTPRAVAVTRRVEHDAVEAPAAPKLACDEALRVVDDPADRPPGEPRQLRVPPRPGDRRPGCVDVNHRGALCRGNQRRQAGVCEQVEHGHARGDRVPEPLPRASAAREQAHLARRGRSQLDGQPVHLDLPRVHVVRPCPAASRLVRQRGVVPRGRGSPLADRRGMRPDDDTRPKPFEARTAAHVEQLVVVHVVHDRPPRLPRPSYAHQVYPGAEPATAVLIDARIPLSSAGRRYDPV